MTFQCGDCSKCGKCYPKIGRCPECDGSIHLTEMDCCPACGAPVTQEMRQSAQRAFMKTKRKQFEALFLKSAE